MKISGVAYCRVQHPFLHTGKEARLNDSDMTRLAQYIEAAERGNTRRSYASAIRHFEIEWKGLLPSTADAVSRYLADHAASLAINTLRQRLAALSRWHIDQGFADPTKSPLVRQVLKGIRAIHAVPERRARPLELAVLQQIDQWLDVAIGNALRSGDRPALLRHTRDRSLMLLGFWRGFRSDELVHLRVENTEVTPGQGMACYLGRSKGDRQLEGRVFKCPALSRLCPVTAFNAWIDLADLTEGPVFRKIDRWGHVAGEPVEFKAGSYHLMFMDLKQPARAGFEAQITLVFEGSDGKRESVYVHAPIANTSPHKKK